MAPGGADPLEATMWSVKQERKADKLPTRGRARAATVLGGAALMVNLCRLHHHRAEKREERTASG